MRTARIRKPSPKAAAAAKRVAAPPRPKRKRSTGAGRPAGMPARPRAFDPRDAAVQKRRRHHRNELAQQQAAARADAQLRAELKAAADEAESAAAAARRRAAELDEEEERRTRRAALHAERVKTLTPHAQGALPDQYVCSNAPIRAGADRCASCALQSHSEVDAIGRMEPHVPLRFGSYCCGEQMGSDGSVHTARRQGHCGRVRSNRTGMCAAIQRSATARL